MDLYATDESLARIEGGLERLAGAERAGALAELAWHLRERDTARSLRIADEAEGLAPAQERSLLARLALVRGEAALFGLDVARARELAHSALDAFGSAGDAVGRGDAYLFEARVENAQGHIEFEKAAAARAREAFEAAGDNLRAAHARAADLLADGPRNPPGSREAIERLRKVHTDPALGYHLSFVEAAIDFVEGRFEKSAESFAVVSQQAAAAGAGDLGLRATLSLSSAVTNLGDLGEGALVAERALGLARSHAWPRWVGAALSNLGRLLTFLHQAERGVTVLQESERILEVLAGSRHHAMVMFYLGDAHLRAGDPARALQSIEQSEAAVRKLGILPELSANLTCAARALSRLGRGGEALAKATEALELARRTRARLWEIEALRSLAEIHADTAPAQALQCLREAIEAAEAQGGHHEKSQLLAEMASAHERMGDLAAALAAERAARQAQSQEQERRAANQLAVSRMRNEVAVLAEREAQVRRLATTDSLTGLANRGHFLGLVAAEIERARRYGGSIGLVMGDVDHFKAINDLHGHPAGDHVLAEVARVLGHRPRTNDVAGRLGGEEFALLLPGADREATLAVAERVRADIEALRIDWNGTPVRVTISLGCTATSPAGEPREMRASAILDAMVAAADGKLYEAKKAGRNRCAG